MAGIKKNVLTSIFYIKTVEHIKLQYSLSLNVPNHGIFNSLKRKMFRLSHLKLQYSLSLNMPNHGTFNSLDCHI